MPVFDKGVVVGPQTNEGWYLLVALTFIASLLLNMNILSSRPFAEWKKNNYTRLLIASRIIWGVVLLYCLGPPLVSTILRNALVELPGYVLITSVGETSVAGPILNIWLGVFMVVSFILLAFNFYYRDVEVLSSNLDSYRYLFSRLPVVFLFFTIPLSIVLFFIAFLPAATGMAINIAGIFFASFESFCSYYVFVSFDKMMAKSSPPTTTKQATTKTTI
ncbi:hypothetical protein BKA69DRAFT_65493 [Paraphysoderma sedebokerense]|nr:hypothetical protein BKA69DRAFT_65493 [Paraphysoderma sedebokerense]